MRKALGTHVIVELFDCNPNTLTNKEYVERALLRAAHESNAKVVDHFFHQFKPYGVSGVVVIEESHYTIHTWPEHGYAAVDLFFCSDDIDLDRAIEVLREEFQPDRISTVELLRGLLPDVSYSFNNREKAEVVSDL